MRHSNYSTYRGKAWTDTTVHFFQIVHFFPPVADFVPFIAPLDTEQAKSFALGYPDHAFSFRRLHRGDWQRHDYWQHRHLLSTAGPLVRLKFWVIPDIILVKRSLTTAPLGMAFLDDCAPRRGVSWRMGLLAWRSLMMPPSSSLFKTSSFKQTKVKL